MELQPGSEPLFSVLEYKTMLWAEIFRLYPMCEILGYGTTENKVVKNVTSSAIIILISIVPKSLLTHLCGLPCNSDYWNFFSRKQTK